MTRYELLASLISLLAVIIAFVSLRRTRIMTRRQLELQTKQTDLQEDQLRMNQRHQELSLKVGQFQLRQYEEGELASKKATVKVRLEPGNGANSHKFLFKNEGPAAAYKINYKIEVSTSSGFSPDREFPKEITRLDPGAEMTLRAIWDRSLRPPILVRLSWCDTEGKEYTDNFQLYF